MNLKLSYYTIFSEPVNEKGDFILYCTRSGKAITLPARIRPLLEGNSFDGIPQKMKDELINVKGLVDESEEELLNIVNENKTAISHSSELYEVIQPSAMCQLGCDYCGQEHKKNYLPNDLFEKITARIRKKAASGNYSNIGIGWFGGEPLMALPQIRVLSKELMALSKEIGIPYSAKVVTNGLSLKKNIFYELVNELNVTHIEVTLDGIAPYHDKRRLTKEGHSTFDIIVGNLNDIFNSEAYDKCGCKISIRCNVDGRNAEGVSPLIKLMAEYEWQTKIDYFYVMGVYSWGGNDAHIKSLKKEEFAAMEINWMIEMLEHGFVPSLLPQRQKQVCMAVSKVSEMYDPYGNVFNCTEVSLTSFYNDTPYALGNLKFGEESIATGRPLSDWNDTLLEDKFPCHSCRMLPVCGGGCPKSWHEDMRACPTAKFNIKDRLLLSYVASKTDIAKLANEAMADAVGI